jgi:dTDP-glucose pyrophosphorylase
MKTATVSKAVVLAAGRGTRMKQLTEDCPKPMLPIQGRPMLAHVVEGMETAGIEEILIVIGYMAELVTDYFAAHPPKRAKLSYARQEKQDGTGSAARLGRDFVGDSLFLLTFGDILVDPETYRSMFDLMGGADAVLAVKQVDDPHQGAAVYTDGALVTRIIEKPPLGTSSTNWNNAGIYCLGPRVFDELDRIPLSPRGEYELTDAIHQMLGAGARFRWHPIEGFWRDVGRPEDLAVAEEYVKGEG